MKLSEIRGERVLEVIADLIQPATAIMQSDEAKELFTARETPEGMTPGEFFGQRVSKALPGLLKAHREDIIAILATLDGVTTEQYAESLTLAKLLQDTYEVLTDEALVGFLGSAGRTTQA